MDYKPILPENTRHLVPGEWVQNGDLIYLPDKGWTPVRHSTGLVAKAGFVCRPLGFNLTQGVNPKDAVAAAKPDLSLVPPALIIWVAKTMEHGARKYSKFNWRDENQKVRLTVYIAAALRHLMALADGEDNAPDSNLPHAAHAAASMGIILDALACGTLIDDRSKPGPAAKLLEQLTEKTK